jgi:pimeloyl-ACP methyl ester carboxylesterase
VAVAQAPRELRSHTVREGRLVRPDGRTVAWTECGDPDGRPILRLPGTPGSRLSLRTSRAPWVERGLRVVTVERPGFGASTRLPGRGFAEHADDLAAVLDRLGADRVPVYGGSGGAPHVLALAGRHPGRVSACSVVHGAAPLTDVEVGQEIEHNAESDGLARAGRLGELGALLERTRTSMLADPVGAYQQAMRGASAADRAVMDDAAWQDALALGLREALAPGVGGWLDEVVAIAGDWRDVDLEAVSASVTWWHGDADRNCPLSSAERLVARLPSARLVVAPGVGHLLEDDGEGEILDELLARA